jgi:hypothetical protein
MLHDDKPCLLVGHQEFTPFVEMVPLFSACLQPAQSLREASAAESFGPLGYPTLFEP